MPSPRILPCAWSRAMHTTSYLGRRSKAGSEQSVTSKAPAQKDVKTDTTGALKAAQTLGSDFKNLLTGIESNRQPLEKSRHAHDSSSDKTLADSPKLSDILLDIQRTQRLTAATRTVQAPNLTKQIDRIVNDRKTHAKHAHETVKAASAAGVTPASYAAVRGVTDALSNSDPTETSQIQSDLLRKLREHETQTSASKAQVGVGKGGKLDRVFADMKYDKSRPVAEPGAMPSEWMDRTIDKAAEAIAPVWMQETKESQIQMQHRQQRKRDRYNSSGDSDLSNLRRPEFMGSPVKLFEGPGLGIFTKNMDKLDEHRDVMLTWDKLYAKKLETQQKVSPRNAFEEMQQWTEQGKLWRFPIDNEQDLEPDGTFDEHIFLMPLIEDFPARGPIRDFMEVVVYALSHNPYLSVREKHDHVDWFRNYFKEKHALLAAALGPEMATFSEPSPAVEKPPHSAETIRLEKEREKFTEVVYKPTPIPAGGPNTTKQYAPKW